MSQNDEWHKRRAAAVARGIAHAVPVFTEHAENASLIDVDGKRYIDFASGIAVLNVGHRHPKVMRAVSEQLQRVTHAAFQVTPYAAYIELAERLNALAPGSTPKKTVLFTTGAEAVENAVKIARFYTKRSAVIAFTAGFHGRTLGTLALTGKVQPYKFGFGPLLPEVYHAPYPMPFHGIGSDDSLAAIERIFKGDVDPGNVAAIVIEPVLGEGGFYIAPPEFMQALRAVCDRHGIMLIADEIQTGFARTGRMFACEHSNVEPDLLVVAKSLAGGLPMSGVIGKSHVMDDPPPGALGGTFGGSPLACAAALAVLDVIRDEQLCDRAQKLGATAMQRLQAFASQGLRGIGEVRGLGSMVALGLVKCRADGSPDASEPGAPQPDASLPDAERTRAVVAAAARRGLVILSCGLYGNVLRLLAPLTIPEGQFAEGLDILRAALEDSPGVH